ncbi:MFS transporter [Rhizobium bangladeshense]|uniref:MFS transporter n=1 Tax=Rhizobium bangladeshense TaxID=1138189 RepID=UPI001C83CEFB|nr:MFS transporter [Rhizobium bangladeshense]MBX4893248.1 MFS transporter [Rhizobium bangladeshense]MBX4898817.1 MFS transporter [Rhizobium bangladeshense]MBY3616886.1 MFS transporter [Rhizobium bangladeshense]
MSERSPFGLSRGTTAVLLFAVFTAAVGYGVVLPVLPHVVEGLSPSASASSIGWHTGFLAAVYAGAPLLFAPVWGWLSDRYGRRPVLLAGLVGFGATLAVTALASNLQWLYSGRFLNGAFAAAILPAAQAFVGDCAVSDTWRAQRFAWLGMASIAGFFIGPMLGGGVFQGGSPITGNMPAAQLLTLPFLFSAGLAFIGAIGIAALDRGPAPPVPTPTRDKDGWRPATVAHLLTLAGFVALGITAFEVGLALRGRALGMTPYQVGIMFAECSLVMFAVQALVFSPLVAPSSTAKLILPAFAIMGAGLLLVAYAEAFAAQLIVVGTVAAGAGVLIPVLSYWISLGAGDAQGAELGRKAAVESFGQALGSAGVGYISGVDAAPYLQFLLPAGLVLAGAAVSLNLARRLSGRLTAE